MSESSDVDALKQQIAWFQGNLTALAEGSAVLNGEVATAIASSNDLWLLFGGILVFFMQTGFAMLEVGMVRIKNTKNILIKNVFDASIGALCWWFFGYGVAFGESNVTADATNSGGIIGTTEYFLAGDSQRDNTMKSMWFFQWAFAATAATIVSGAVAERVSFGCYIAYSVVLTSFIYPVVVHWAWTNGWGSAWRECVGPDCENLLFGCGVTDFAGSGVVHMTGGIAALVASKFIGARIGRFDNGGVKLPQQSVIFQTLGTLILWFGWYGFNCVSTLAIHGLSGAASHAAVTTTIAAATGCLANSALTMALDPNFVLDIGAANNGILAGLVSITAGCSTVSPFGAFCIGLISAPVYYFSAKLLERLEVDDVVGAVPVHGFCGAWGVIATGFFITKEQYASAYYADRASECAGVFYGGNGSSLAANAVFVLAVLGWVGVTSAILFLVCYFTIGVRVSSDVEEAGMDDSKHGGKIGVEAEVQAVIGTSKAVVVHADDSQI